MRRLVVWYFVLQASRRCLKFLLQLSCSKCCLLWRTICCDRHSEWTSGFFAAGRWNHNDEYYLSRICGRALNFYFSFRTWIKNACFLTSVHMMSALSACMVNNAATKLYVMYSCMNSVCFCRVCVGNQTLHPDVTVTPEPGTFVCCRNGLCSPANALHQVSTPGCRYFSPNQTRDHYSTLDSWYPKGVGWGRGMGTNQLSSSQQTIFYGLSSSSKPGEDTCTTPGLKTP